MSEQNAQAEEGPSVYIVQVLSKENGTQSYWQDVARVEVPPRTRRKTIIEKAQEMAEPNPLVDAGGNGTVVRVLDEESAYGYPVAMVTGPPRLVIG